MRNFINSIIERVLLFIIKLAVVGVIALQVNGLHANTAAGVVGASPVKQYRCVAKKALGHTQAPSVCYFDLEIDSKNSLATLTWEEQVVKSSLNGSNDNFAGFTLANDAEAGVWQQKNKTGDLVWVGMISVSDEDGLCSMSCEEVEVIDNADARLTSVSR